MTEKQKQEREKQIQALMSLGNTREEAEQTLIDDDLDIETDEMKEMAKKAKASGALKVGAKSVDAYGKKRVREHKDNADKQEIISTIDDALCDLVDNVTVSNKERQIDFEYNGVKYSVTLTAHRAPKEKK